MPTGGETTVGLAGATLGGGLGFLTRSFGMACDNLMAAEIVVPSGAGGATAITADEHNNSDLLWALRGAGNGNFGIVTSFTYRMHPLKQVGLVEAQWNGLENLRGVFDAWQRQAPATDLRLSSVLSVGRDRIDLQAVLHRGRRPRPGNCSRRCSRWAGPTSPSRPGPGPTPLPGCSRPGQRD